MVNTALYSGLRGPRADESASSNDQGLGRGVASLLVLALEDTMAYNQSKSYTAPEAGVLRGTAEASGAGPLGHNDDLESEHGTRPDAILRARRPFCMGTFNAATAREEARMLEIVHCAEVCGIEILGIQEHRRVHPDDLIVFKKIESRCLITASAWRNSVQAANGGVGLLLSHRARKALRKVQPHSQRILVAEFSGNPATTVIVCYSPTNAAPEEEVEKFYEELRVAIQTVPSHNFLVILGDLNARLGTEDVPFSFHDETNRNGKYLADLLTEHELLAANTQFRKRIGKRWTFKDRATGAKRQLDYILARKKWRNSILNAESYSSFESVGSDHRVVSMTVRLSLRAPKPPTRVRYDWKAFSVDTELHRQYAVHVKNRFQVLAEEEDPTECYERFISANAKAMKECVPVRERTRPSQRTKHPDIVDAREKVKRASRGFELNRDSESREVLNEAKQYLYSTYDRLKGEELREKVQRVEAAHGDMQYAESWKVINEMSGRKRSKEGQVIGNSPEERVDTWMTHFSNLLGGIPVVEDPEGEILPVLTDLNIKDGPFTANEYNCVKASLQQGKSSGPDNIPPEVLKNCDLDELVLEMCNQALTSGENPKQWSLANIIPVPKSGDLSKPDNYRGISLSCVIVKMRNRMILNRLRTAIDPHLRDNQNGFREKRTTAAQILALRRVIEEVKKNNLPAVLCFIDFRKAFDSIHRGKMMKILKAYDVPPNLLRAIKSMYSNTRAKVVTPDGNSDEFEVSAGVLQGDTLAPYLFIIVLDYALRQAIQGREVDLGLTITPRKASRSPAVALTDFDFADDIGLLSNNLKQAQELLTRVEKECVKVGLTLNAKKTEVITFSQPPDHPSLTTIGGLALKEVIDFKYLGSWVTTSEKDIKVRKALAWRALNGMKTVWSSRMSRETKLSFFFATVESVLLYGSECWTLTSQLQRSLDGCYTRMLRQVLDIEPDQHIRNESLYQEVPRVTNKIAYRRMGLAGHCYRHPELPANKVILWTPTHGRRNRGRPCTTMVNVLMQDAGAASPEELAMCMTERTDWQCRRRVRLRTT